MAVSLISRIRVGCWLLTMAVPLVALGQTNLVPQGGEYPLTSGLLGDQVRPAAAIRPWGGFVVWQDSYADGEGLGVSAIRLDSSLSATLSPFRVNQTGAEDQEKPRVSLFASGGGVFTWQGGRQGFQQIYARFLSASNTWVGGEVMVNGNTNTPKTGATVCTLSDDSVVIAWGSFNQDSDDGLQGVYAQRFSAVGAKLGGEFRVNDYTSCNQRTPALVTLSDGRFVVVWVSEDQRFENSVDIYARFYSATGIPAGTEFLVNSGTNTCANPSVAASGDGGFLVAWSEKDVIERSNSWDIVTRAVSGVGLGGVTRRVNTQLFGDQIAPQVSVLGTDYLVVWTSLGQDGSREGVYGQYLRNDGSLLGGEFRNNTTTLAAQIHPTIASDGVERFLVLWSSFGFGVGSFDLYGQRYANTAEAIPAPAAPFINVLSSNALKVTWPEMAGFAVAQYEVFADGAGAATAVVTNNWWTMTNLASGSTHSARLACVLVDGRRSPLSDATTNSTYGPWLTWGGIPQEWMADNFGSDLSDWPAPRIDSDADGVSNRDEFLAGTDPKDAKSVLRSELSRTLQGLYLVWNTRPGQIYQVQASADFDAWNDLGRARFAADSKDSIYVGGSAVGYYRVVMLR